MLKGFKLEGRLRSVVLLAVAALAVLAAPGVARADTVTRVEPERVERAVRRGGAGPPQASVPHMAMVHGAIYDAVNAIDGGHEGYLLTSRLAQPFDSKDAAAAAAAHRVLLNIVPAQQARSRRPVRGVAGGDPGRLGEDTRDRSRRGRRGGDDRGQDGRRPLRCLSLPGRVRVPATGGRYCRPSSTTRTRG